jgi:hypothetical protein
MAYLPSIHMLYLDSMTGGNNWVGGGVIGQAGTLDNGMCSVNLAGATESRNGTDLTLSVPVAPKMAYRYMYLSADNAAGSADWTYFGVWPLF